MLKWPQVALNEQFMVAALNTPSGDTPSLDQPQKDPAKAADSKNRVLHVLIRRLTSAQSFGENMIFMLNRASKCLQAEPSILL
jgi:Protein of unknown function (DUF2013)